MKRSKISALVLAAIVALPLAAAPVFAIEESDAVHQTKTQALGYLGELSESIILSGRLQEFKSTARYNDIYAGGESVTKRVKFWHNVALDTSALDHTPYASPDFEPGTVGEASPDQGGPTRTSRAMAMVHVAMFDALNAIEDEYNSYIGGVNAAEGASADAAVAFAAARMLRRLYPVQKDRINEIFRAEKARIRDITSRDEFRAGRAVGIAAFKAVRDARRGDKSRRAEPNFGDGGRVANGGKFTYFGSRVNRGGDAIGEWQSDPNVPAAAPDFELALGAFWGNVRPFFLDSGDQFRSPPPPLPDVDFAVYAKAFAEAAAVGGAEDNANTPSTGTDRTRFIGNYWGYDGVPLIGVPPRIYNQITSQLAFKEYKNDALAFARVLAMTNIAMADVSIAAWDSKYFYNYWRPVTGVRVDDANPLTFNDPTWDPVGTSVVNTAEAIRPTPPFPAYPSGHAAFGAAVFEILRESIRDNTKFTFVSDEYNGTGVTPTEAGPVTRPLVPVRFGSLTAAQESNGVSRIYNGVHWSFDNTAGQDQGESIARFLLDDVDAFQVKW
ncbi:MAG: phosphatase PAP2 family protein [Gammaproteobacteria bacterium]|nr:phosphatase PAP2 family protein [Gammaproteobacteria bacterium]